MSRSTAYGLSTNTAATIVTRDANGRIDFTSALLASGFTSLDAPPSNTIEAGGGFLSGRAVAGQTPAGVWNAITGSTDLVAVPNVAAPKNAIIVQAARGATVEFWLDINAGQSNPNTAGMAIGSGVARSLNALTTDLIFSAFAAGAWTEVMRLTNGGTLQILAGQGLDTRAAGTLSIGAANATTITIGRAGQVVNFGVGVTALGGGLAATMGTIGGAGPLTAAQNSWLPVQVAGASSWIPIWR